MGSRKGQKFTCELTRTKSLLESLPIRDATALDRHRTVAVARGAAVAGRGAAEGAVTHCRQAEGAVDTAAVASGGAIAVYGSRTVVGILMLRSG